LLSRASYSAAIVVYLPLPSKGGVVDLCFFKDLITVEGLDLGEMTNSYYVGNLYLTSVGVLFWSTMTCFNYNERLLIE